MQLYIHSVKFPLKFYFRLNSKLRLPVGLLNCEGSLILTHSGSGLVRRKTVIGINIATSASRSIGNLRWLLDRESAAAICGQASFIVKVERRGFYIHQEIAPGASAWLVHHDSDGSQNLFLCEEKNVSFYTFWVVGFFLRALSSSGG